MTAMSVTSQINHLKKYMPRFAPFRLKNIAHAVTLPAGMKRLEFSGIKTQEDDSNDYPPRERDKKRYWGTDQKPYSSSKIHISNSTPTFRPRKFKFLIDSIGKWSEQFYEDMLLRGFHAVHFGDADALKKPSENEHLPKDTEHWFENGIIYSGIWSDLGITVGRWDQLMDQSLEDIKASLASQNGPALARDWTYIKGYARVILDLEPDENIWYPTAVALTTAWDVRVQVPAISSDALEKKWYQGFARLFEAAISYIRDQGWTEPIGIYEYAPFQRRFWEMGTPPNTSVQGEEVSASLDTSYWAFDMYGQYMMQHVDFLCPVIYSKYDPRNTSYNYSRSVGTTTWNLHNSRRLGMGKDMFPFLANWYDGGGDGATTRYWFFQPMTDALIFANAMIVFMSGCKGGIVWSNTALTPTPNIQGNPWRVETFTVNYMHYIKSAFSIRNTGNTATRVFVEDEPIIVTGVSGTGASALVSFRLVDATSGATPTGDTYQMTAGDLSEYVKPFYHGLDLFSQAIHLATLFEDLLYDGEEFVEASTGKDQWNNTQPYVGYVRSGKYYFLMSYDQQRPYQGSDRTFAIPDFGGVTGRTLTVPCTDEPQFWLIEDV